MTDLFKDAFAPLKPLIVADYEGYVTRIIKRYTETWDTMSDAAKLSIFRGNDGTWRFARRARPTGEVRAEWLRKNAEQSADAQIAAFAAKLEKKLGTLGDFTATFTRGADFIITGTRNGHRVVVEQQTVFKVSSNGTPFNQFPARIYVDGKFTPAADYARAVSA